MKRLIVGCLSLVTALAQGQTLPTWVDDIAPIVHTHCAHCHHNGGAGPFPLVTYEDVFFTANADVHVIQDGEMPPWPADPAYQHFVGENVLSDQDVARFVEWYETGMAYGDEEVQVELPTFGPEGSLLESLDFVADFPAYTLQSDAEEYRWFVVPTNFEETRYIQAVEVIPGLAGAVHHADIFVDVTGESMALDQADPLPGFNGATGWPTNTTYINAWQPGALPARYPDGWGIPVPPGADLVIEIHYGPDFGGQEDDTVMNLEWVDEAEVRPISVGWLLGNGAMTDGPLVIPPDVISTFHQEAVLFNTDKSLLSICPHMHLLGKSYQVWMETPAGDSIPLIDIPQWHFEWQFYYRFLSPVHVPAGTVFKAVGEYDNTVWNPLNPNDPPETVTYGSLTTDEMFLTYFIWADYEEGDEDLVFGTIEEEVDRVTESPVVKGFEVWPTLASDVLSCRHDEPGALSAVVRNAEGAWCWSGTLDPGVTRLDVSSWPAGTYVMQVGGMDKRTSRTWIKQ